MLILTRNIGEAIIFRTETGKIIKVILGSHKRDGKFPNRNQIRVYRNQIRVLIDAPDEIEIYREEIYERILAEEGELE